MKIHRSTCPAHLLLLKACLIFSVVLLAALAGGTRAASAQAGGNACLACHSNAATLKSASPRWREVLIDPARFAADKHGSLACTACHGSDYYSAFPHTAPDSFPTDPADPSRVNQTCGACHKDITDRHVQSLHSTLEGHKLALVDLMGQEAGMAKFQACTSCHATCSDCHMKQVDRYGRLVPATESHAFARQPAAQVCMVCHGQTGETYAGVPNDQSHGPSIMATAGLACTDCHTEQEVHGNGERPKFMGQAVKPTCEQCHSLDKTQPASASSDPAPRQFDPLDPAHRLHADTVSCVGCHTQWYANCWDCHRGATTVTDRDRFFLSVNPLTGKVQTAVHSPINWELGGVPPETGGWAIKSRHSWGTAKTCETCHTGDSVYIDKELRKGQFVALWATDAAKASFVPESRVQQIVIDPAALAQSVHKGNACLDCHRSEDNQTCVACHNGKAAGADRTKFTGAKQDLAEAARMIEESRAVKLDVTAWEKRYEELQRSYATDANRFHGDPAASQKLMAEVAQAAAALRGDIAAGIRNAQIRLVALFSGLPLAGGILIAVGAVSYMRKGRKQ